MHFLLQCPSYCERRDTLLSQIEKYCVITAADIDVRYKAIMSSKNEIVMKALGAYVVGCFKI